MPDTLQVTPMRHHFCLAELCEWFKPVFQLLPVVCAYAHLWPSTDIHGPCWAESIYSQILWFYHFTYIQLKQLEQHVLNFVVVKMRETQLHAGVEEEEKRLTWRLLLLKQKRWISESGKSEGCPLKACPAKVSNFDPNVQPVLLLVLSLFLSVHVYYYQRGCVQLCM